MQGLNRGVAQSGSVLDWGSSGRWFKSSRPDFFYFSAGHGPAFRKAARSGNPAPEWHPVPVIRSALCVRAAVSPAAPSGTIPGQPARET